MTREKWSGKFDAVVCVGEVLSGVTNEPFSVTVDGFNARYHIGTNNDISIDTKYNANGAITVYAKAVNTARIYDQANPPNNSKLFFSGTGTMPLDFENDTYMAFSGDNSSPNVGTNYFMFVVDKAQDVDATITDLATGQQVAHFSGHVPYPATIELPWNFTQADGATAYSNDTYVVHFIAYDPSDLSITNTIDRHGVRTAARNITCYEEEDLASGGTPSPTFLNSQANTYVGGQEIGLYESLYDNDFLSSTIYTTSQIGNNRNNTSSSWWPAVLTHGSEAAWANQVLPSLADPNYSDFTFYMGHGNGTEIGGGPLGSTFVTSYLPSSTVYTWVNNPATGPNHRMRKVALWACYTDSPDLTGQSGSEISFARAFGIRGTPDQTSSWMMKNVGLFFGGGLPQGGYSGTFGGMWSK